MKRSAGTYVQITREDLEYWLDAFFPPWKRVAGKTGIYHLYVGTNVAVKLSSTIGSKDEVMGRGLAGMQLALISTVTGQTLNKKAQGQSHFARTTNWSPNWRKGVEKMKEAYLKSKGFYDALALIEDRDKYQQDLLQRIEAIPGWQSQNIFMDFHRKVQEGGILSTAQVEVIVKAEKAPAPKPAASADDEALLAKMRDLYRAAQKDGNRWLVEFLTSVGQQVKSGRRLSEKQQQVLSKSFNQYGISLEKTGAFVPKQAKAKGSGRFNHTKWDRWRSKPGNGRWPGPWMFQFGPNGNDPTIYIKGTLAEAKKEAEKHADTLHYKGPIWLLPS